MQEVNTGTTFWHHKEVFIKEHHVCVYIYIYTLTPICTYIILLEFLQYVGPPVGFVQQFVIKSAVSPWHPQQMIPTDAFRAPLSRVFQVLHEVESFQHQTRYSL